MYDWIIEADIYRLRRAAQDSTKPDERADLERLADAKALKPEALKREGSSPSGA